MRSLRGYLLLLVITLAMPAVLGGEQIRALIVAEARVASDSEYEKVVEIALEEAALIYLEEETHFLDGIRLELHLSNVLKKNFDSYALAVYKNLSPQPQRSIRFYEGRRALFQYLPYLNRIYVQISIGKQQTDQLPVGTFRLAEPVRKEDFPLLITMIPLTKGFSAELMENKFYFSIKPLLEKKGRVTLSLHFPPGLENEPFTLTLDNREISPAAGQQELASGIHQLRVLSSAFKEVNATFTVESGKSSLVDVYLEEKLSQLTIDAPQGAELYLDGQRLADSAAFPLTIAEGSHLVRVKIADRSLSKKFTVQRGKHYHLSVIFDIIVNED